MAGGFDRDPHSQDGQACPKNHFGITSYAELARLEKVYVQQRSVEIGQRGLAGVFDRVHLCSIHGYLFQDVFPWAGQLRLVGLSKAGGAAFAVPQFITPALDDLFGKLEREGRLRGLSVDAFAQRGAFYLGEINAIHPFREGNGRTQREFLRQLAVAAGHTISWEGFTQEEMVVASIRSHTQGDNSQLASIVRAALVATDEERDEK